MLVIRCIMIMLFFLLTIVGRKLRQPAAWMLHYLMGSGKSKAIPQDLLEEAVLPAMRNELRENDWEMFPDRFLIKSVSYDGCGFNNRPTMFYLVGGFHLDLEDLGSEVIVSGEDRYDWHGTDEGQYYVSPIGAPNWVLVILDFLTGRNEYFIHSGNSYCSITGEVGISNKLWWALGFVGAKPFITTFEGKYTWSQIYEEIEPD